MEQPPTVFPPALSVLIWLVLWGTAAAWIVVGRRLWRKEPVLVVEPRRAVPWTGIDLLAILGVYLASGLAVARLGLTLFGPEAAKATVLDSPSDLERMHPIVQLLSKANWPAVAACALMAVVVAPLTEEVPFRLFLQGWLEKLDRRWRRAVPALGQWFRWGTLPVLMTSLLFALLHHRGEFWRFDHGYLLFVMVGHATVALSTVVVAVGLVRWVRGATWDDLGWAPEKVLPDVGLGLVGFLTVAVPIYAMQLGIYVVLTRLSTAKVVPDPFPLFFFAMLLGTLYLRTHRIVPSIVAHMALNAVSLALLWVTSAQ